MKATALAYIEKVIQAFDDWTVTYAPEFSHKDDVEVAQERINEAGGVFLYSCEQARNLNDFLYETEDELTANEKWACSRAMILIAEWSLTLPGKAKDSAEAKEVMNRIMEGGGTLALICKIRMPLEAIRDRLETKVEA